MKILFVCFVVANFIIHPYNCDYYWRFEINVFENKEEFENIDEDQNDVSQDGLGKNIGKLQE